jgi:hypothetical protein
VERKPQSWDGVRFRANPSVELKPLELDSDPGFHGLFIPKPPFTMNLKAAARQTAELFQSLATPSCIDRALLEDAEYAADVIDLVLDGILEIESDAGFVSGSDAIRFAGVPLPDPGGALSRDALLHAQELAWNDPETLAMALYRYNHVPISPFWKARFPTPEAVLVHVGADRGTLRAALERNWTLSHDADGYNADGWLSWLSAAAPAGRDRDAATYKLYVSPRPMRIRDAFEVLVRVLTAIPATFKIGSNAAGLLRADKLIAYFATREQLEQAASMMQRELAGCEAQGVPFTAPLDEDGLLSWGVDPPETDAVLRRLQRTSWRLWVVQRLGGALAVAKAARTASAVEPWRFAVARIQRLGIDAATWTPSPALWSLS